MQLHARMNNPALINVWNRLNVAVRQPVGAWKG